MSPKNGPDYVIRLNHPPTLLLEKFFDLRTYAVGQQGLYTHYVGASSRK